jgi:pilus assembly protein Flp/PilA
MDTLSRMASMLRGNRDDQDGQGLAEYALILALIAIVAIVALLYLGTQISDKLSIVGNAI